MEGHHVFIHGDNPFEKRLGLLVNAWRWSCCRFWSSPPSAPQAKIGSLLGQFFYQAQVLLKDDKNCSNWDRIGLGKVLYSHPGIFLDSGGDSSDELKVPLGFLGVQVALILRHFAGLHFVNKVVYCGFVKALVPKSRSAVSLISPKLFPALAMLATKSLTPVIVLSGGGNGGRLCSGPPSTSQRIPRRKLSSHLLTVMHRAKIYIK